MAGNTLTASATLTCPHGAQVTIVCVDNRVCAGGQPLATPSDSFTVAGCPFQLPTTPPIPSPCVKVQWMSADTHVTRGDAATLSETSSGLCLNAQGIPQGPVVIGLVAPGATSQ